MSLTELKPHYPGHIDVPPTCADAEWYWLDYFHTLQGSEGVHAKTSHIVSAHDKSRSWITSTIQKGPIEEIKKGSKTFLCLTGEIAGFIAANTTSHAHRLRTYFQLPDEHFIMYQGVLMRPLLSTPPFRRGFDYLQSYRNEGNERWFLDALIEQITSLSLPIDEEIFRSNVTQFSQGFPHL